jgi:hypothetical protein
MHQKENGMISRRHLLKLAVAGGSAVAVKGRSLVGFAHPGSVQVAGGVAHSPETSSRLSKSVLYYGKAEPLPKALKLQAGPVSMIFEPEEGFLRYIQIGNREVLRGIYAAVRNRNWGTVPSRLSNLKLESTRDSFRLSFDMVCREREIDFSWKGILSGDPMGTLSFSLNGTAGSTFLRNRIGFCVLHPIRECAGRPCVVQKVDGSEEQGTFPGSVAPHQPFKEMQAISHEVLPGLSAEVRFQGEIFEMEDQRNWTDASYKTYCTPLALPFPVEVKAGTKIAQSVTLTLKGQATSDLSRAEVGASEVILSASEKGSSFLPDIGLGSASNGRPLSEKQIERLKALKLSHLRVDLNLSERNVADLLRAATREAETLSLPLEAALFLSDSAEDELNRFEKELRLIKPRVSRWLIFHVAEKSTTARWVQMARRHLSTIDFKAKIGGGTNAYFTELNRERPPLAALDLVCYSINPQVHAFDNATLVENLEAQGYAVESARQFSGNRPLVITPVTLKPRFNPNATGAEAASTPGELPASVDPRQISLLGAGWTLGSLKYLAQSGVQSVTYYETIGWRGVMEVEAGSPLPNQFHSIAGAVFPLYHVLADMGEFAGAEVVPLSSTAPLKVEGTILQKAGRVRILLANLNADPQFVRLIYPGLPQYVRVKRLDETNAESAMRSPESYRAAPGLLQETAGKQLALSLLPYSVCRIDSARPLEQGR